MTVVGRWAMGTVPRPLLADEKLVKRLTFQNAWRVPKLSVLLDGLGAASGQQVARCVVYDRDDALLAQGEEVVVRAGQPLAWVDFPLTNLEGGGLLLPRPGDYDFGLHAGPVSGLIRVFS